MKINNIIFDIDGTLLDSKQDIAAAQQWVLRQLGVYSYAPEDLYLHIGKTLQETFSLLLPETLHHRITPYSFRGPIICRSNPILLSLRKYFLTSIG